MTPSLKEAIRLLSLPPDELRRLIEAELRHASGEPRDAVPEGAAHTQFPPDPPR